MTHNLTDGEQAMLLAIAKERHPSWRIQTLPGNSIQRSISPDREKGFALVATTVFPDCGFLALMVLIEQLGTSTEKGKELVQEDGTVLQLFRNVPVQQARNGWFAPFETMEDQPIFGKDRPAIVATRSGRLWVQDAIHNSYELSLPEVEKLLQEVTVEQRSLLERMLEEAQTPRSS